MNASSVDACSKLWPASQRRWSRFHVVGGVDDAAFAKLCSLLRYIDGDYSDPATFDALRRELGHAAHPLHYLAIPLSLFGTVVRELGRSHRRRFPSRDREAVRA
jgi:glucose-6-phosphate 1-dehydrogenase